MVAIIVGTIIGLQASGILEISSQERPVKVINGQAMDVV